jgi:two-component system, OmpR family, sensor histidine kinase VicK
VIIRNARRLNILTENLLDLAKIESNALKLHRETFNLPELIAEAIADVKSQLLYRQVVVNVEYNDGSADGFHDKISNNSDGKQSQDNNHHFLVKADKTRIMQVISNLLNNAIKFTRGGKVVTGLDNIKGIKGSRKEGEGEGYEQGGDEEEAKTEREVIVSFKDSGTGIAPEILDKIFEKFVTESDKGTGLGLFISKKIVEAHGGRTWAKNNIPEEGATIAFSLPQ